MRRTFLIVVLSASVLLATGLIRRRPHNPHIEPKHSIEVALKPPQRVSDILHQACYDCHSSETHWPWYSAVAPVSGALEQDVRHGREAVNFSEWTISAGSSRARAAATLYATCAAVKGG